MAFSIEYMAGLVDGEGCISLAASGEKKYQKFYPRLSVTNTYLPVLEELQKQYGGHIKAKTPSKASIGRNWSIGYDWRVSGDTARKLIAELIPHLFIKKQKALEVLLGDQKKRK